MFPFIGTLDLVRMKQINKTFCARITNYFRINRVRCQTYRIDPPLDENLETVALPSRKTIREYRNAGRPLPKLLGTLYIEDDENLKEFNWVLDNGQTFKFKCCSWNGNKFDYISYLENKKVAEI
jgi:hypothetical protein